MRRAGTTTLHRLAESIPWNRFLGSLNVYKFGLCYSFTMSLLENFQGLKFAVLK
jgi:hypothetical protein